MADEKDNRRGRMGVDGGEGRGAVDLRVTDVRWMKAVLERCRVAVGHSEFPFAAAVVFHGDVIALEHNVVSSTDDPTAHAEMLAIRTAAEKLDSPDLSDCTLYCSCEPCPMCFAAAVTARVSRVVYGATIGDAALHGHPQLPIFASQLKAMGRLQIEIVPELMRDEFTALMVPRMKSL